MFSVYLLNVYYLEPVQLLTENSNTIVILRVLIAILWLNRCFPVDLTVNINVDAKHRSLFKLHVDATETSLMLGPSFRLM